MASNDYFELTEKYKNNKWAAKIHDAKRRDLRRESEESDVGSNTSAINHRDYSHTTDPYGTHESNCENTGCTSHEYSVAKLKFDDMQLFGYNPRTDNLHLVMCWECGKLTKVQSLLPHILDAHTSLEEYEKRNDISKQFKAYEKLHKSRHEAAVKEEVSSVSSRKRKKGTPENPSSSQMLPSDGFSEERSEDIVPECNPFLSQNYISSQVPVEGEISAPRDSNSCSVTKRKKGSLKHNRNKSKKGKTEVNCQSQENVHNLSNSVHSEQSTSSALWTENVSYSNHDTNPDSNHSVNSGHSGMITSSSLYPSNHSVSITQSAAFDFQSREGRQEFSEPNYLHQSSLSMLNTTEECSEQLSCANNLESNEVIRTSSSQSCFKQMSERTSFHSNNKQDTEFTDNFLSIENKQPVKSPPTPCQETSISNNKQSKHSKTFLGVEKESSASSICSSPKPSVEDSFSKISTSVEDKPKNDRKVSSIHTPALYCARPNISINRLAQSPYGLVLLNDRSDRLRRALAKAVAEENARIKENLRMKAILDESRCGTESNSPFISPKSVSELSAYSASEPPSNFVGSESFSDFVSEQSPNFVLQSSPSSALQSSPSSGAHSTPHSFPSSLSSSYLVYSDERCEAKRQCSPTKSVKSEESLKLLGSSRNECDSLGNKAVINLQNIDFNCQTTISASGLNTALESSLCSVPQLSPNSISQTSPDSALPSSPNSASQSSPNSVSHSVPNSGTFSSPYLVFSHESHEPKRHCSPAKSGISEEPLKLSENGRNIVPSVYSVPQLFPCSAPPNSMSESSPDSTPLSSPNSIPHSAPNSVTSSYVVHNFKQCEATKSDMNKESLNLLENRTEYNSGGRKVLNSQYIGMDGNSLLIGASFPFKINNGVAFIINGKNSENSIKRRNNCVIIHSSNGFKKSCPNQKSEKALRNTVDSDNYTKSNWKSVCDNNLNNSDLPKSIVVQPKNSHTEFQVNKDFPVLCKQDYAKILTDTGSTEHPLNAVDNEACCPDVKSTKNDTARKSQVEYTKFNIKTEYIPELNKDVIGVSQQSDKKENIASKTNCYPPNSQCDTWRNSRNLQGGKTAQFGRETAKEIANT